MPKYISGRIRRTPQDQLSDVRYDYLKLSEAEPNLGDPDLNNTPILPAGEQYIIVSIPGSPVYHQPLIEQNMSLTIRNFQLS